MTWEKAFRNRKFRIDFLVTAVMLILVLIALTKFLNFAETRNGIVFWDPILSLFEPIDLTWFIFITIYISLFIALFFFVKNPPLLVIALQSYVVLVVFRIIAMYLLPLNPPVKMLPLSDPFVEFFGTGQLLTKDLFFSGHTATLFLIFLLAEKKSLRIFLLVSTILVALSVLLQHVHYTVDVFTAPFFTFCSVRIIKSMGKNYLP